VFQPVSGYAWYGYILGSLVLTVLVIGLLMLIPPRFRRNVILAVTFLGGLFIATEFFWPTHPAPTPDDPKHVANFLTPSVTAFNNIVPVIGAWTIGLGVLNLIQVQGKRLMRGGSAAFYSAVFFLSAIAMLIVNILQQAHPNLINVNLNKLLFDGFYKSLDATLFSIIAFFIVSAAYRAFRIRSVDATILLVTAIIVMLGQISLGQMITMHLPDAEGSFWRNFRIEVVRDWILTKANTPALRAIAFGLGIGSLAVALRIWLGLERGSYFDRQG
jgi:hypothetical protein